MKTAKETMDALLTALCAEAENSSNAEASKITALANAILAITPLTNMWN